MDKVLILIFALLLCGCADSYATHANVNGVSGPNDLVPQPFPDPPANTQK